MTWSPSVVRAEVVVAATPEPFTGTFDARVVAPSVNVTVPELTVLELVTVAVKVTELFGAVANDGLLLDVTMVVVANAAPAVVMSILQPPEKLPESPPVSSTTYKLQVPFGPVPLKTEANVAVPCVAGSLYGPAGAGAAKVSPVP